MSTDRFATKYPGLSPYNYAANNPLLYIDVNGDSIYVENRVNRSGFWGAVAGFFGFKRTNTYVLRGNQYFNVDTGAKADLSTSGYLSSVAQAITDLNATPSGQKLVGAFAGSASNNLTIAKGSNSYSNRRINWDPSNTTSALDVTGSTSRPAYIGLGHEMAHAYDDAGFDYAGTPPPGFRPYGGNTSPWLDTAGNRVINPRTGRFVPLSEMYASYVENLIRAEAGLPARAFYDLSGNLSTGRLPIPTVKPSWIVF